MSVLSGFTNARVFQGPVADLLLIPNPVAGDRFFTNDAGMPVVGYEFDGNIWNQDNAYTVAPTTVAKLPTGGAAPPEGSTGYATDGRKATEGGGAGTGAPCYYSGAGPAGAGWYQYQSAALIAA